MTTTTVELWVMVDEDGNYVASHDEGQLNELYGQDFDAEQVKGLRRVKVTLVVPLPVVIEVTGTVTDDETATLTSVR